MSERWLIMKESEFEAVLYYQERAYGCDEDSESVKDLKEAEAACRARPISLDRLEALEKVATQTQKMVTTLEKLMKICDVDFIVTIDGQEHRVDVTKEVKDALAAVEEMG